MVTAVIHFKCLIRFMLSMKDRMPNRMSLYYIYKIMFGVYIMFGD